MSNQNPTPPKSDVEIRQTLEKSMSISEKALDLITDIIAKPQSGKSKIEALTKLTDEQQKQLIDIQENALAGFIGQLDELESALGMLIMGHHFGWKILYLIHSKRTIRKYEDILGIKIRDIFPEEGPSSYRSPALALAKKATNFWKVVSGEEKIPDKRKVE
jgi:hypothetical protein